MEFVSGILLLFIIITGYGYYRRIRKFDPIWKKIVGFFYLLILIALFLMFIEIIPYSYYLVSGLLIQFFFSMIIAYTIFKQENSPIFS